MLARAEAKTLVLLNALLDRLWQRGQPIAALGLGCRRLGLRREAERRQDARADPERRSQSESGARGFRAGGFLGFGNLVGFASPQIV